MAARVFTVCFDTVHTRTSQLRRAFHVTTKQHYARAVKRRSLFSQNLHGTNAANVLSPEPPQPQTSNRLDDVRGIIEPLNDDSHFEYDDLSYMISVHIC